MKKNTQKGFTLLEVLIGLTLLSFLSYFTAQSMRGALDMKVKIRETLDTNALIRNAAEVIQRDIQLAFQYKDIRYAMHNRSQEDRYKYCEAKAKSKYRRGSRGSAGNNRSNRGRERKNRERDLDRAYEFCQDIKASFKKRKPFSPSHFIGMKNKISFTNLNFIRTRESQPVSSQAEVSYFLKDCSHRGHREIKSQCLWRRISPFIDDRAESGGIDSVLVENVESLNFRYLSFKEGLLNWREDWIFNEGGDSQTRGRFPAAVEITLKLKSKNKKISGITLIAPLSFPNNFLVKNLFTKSKIRKEP